MGKQNTYFTKITNEVFYTVEKEGKKEKTLLEKCNKNYKVLLVLDYLYTNTNRKDITMFTLEDMIKESGFKVKKGQGKSIEQFKTILDILQDEKMIECDKCLNNIKPKEFIKCKCNLFKIKEEKDTQFTMIYDSEKEKINNYEGKIDKLKLLFYYCYIKSRIHRNKKGKEAQIVGGRYENAYPSYKTITKDTNLTDDVIKKYNDILVELNMLRIGNAGLYVYKNDNNKIKRESPNVYALYHVNEEVWKTNIKQGIKLYKKLYGDEREFINTREYKNNNKKINGYISRINQLEKEGKATQEQLEKRDSCINSKDEDIQKKVAIFKKNPDMLLSEIFDSQGNEKYFDKAFKLEKDLGLLNKEDDLTVDYEYYKWIIINYKLDKKEYYKNCIKKHIEKNDKKTKNKGKFGLKNDKNIIDINNNKTMNDYIQNGYTAEEIF